MDFKLEVIAFNIESCNIAQENGADRIELCDNPFDGGTTPSYGMIKTARENLKIQLFPIIRPRGGDFLYSRLELEIMKKDVEICKELGCDGVVIGILEKDGKINISQTKELVKIASPMEVTFHRAFDRCIHPLDSLEMVIDCGCSRILTSGTRPNVDEGKNMLKALNEKSNKRITIMPGSGLRSSNIEEIAQTTGCMEFHSSARINKKSAMSFKNDFMQENLDYVVLDPHEVKEMKAKLIQLQTKSHH